MRRSFIPLAVAALLFACADSPTAPQMQSDEASFGITGSYPPPPWALIEGIISTDGDGGASFSRMTADGAASMSHSPGETTARFRAWLLVTPGGQAALLRFTEGGTATFSKGAMITKVNGKVSGKGTMTVGGHAYDLGAVTTFTANGECATTAYDGPSCASFSAGDGSFSSAGSVWTGVLSKDGVGSGVPSSCTASPDFIVTNQAELSAALAAVTAGGTIAIDGIIEVTSMIPVEADDIRLTCATDGSGLIIASGSAPFAVLHVSGDGVQVDNLFLSSVPSSGVGGATHGVFANNSTGPPGYLPEPVERFRLSLNRIRCAIGTCAFLVSAPGAVVSDNIVESLGPASGIHVQGNPASPTDGTIVERNHIIATTVSGSLIFGAIRVRDGSQLVVRHNSSSGPWRNGIALAELDGGLIENNFIRGALNRGIIGSTNSPSPVSVRNSIIRTNTIEGPQAIGINLLRACWNSVQNNDISVAAGALRAQFEVTTGANVYVGNSALVVDLGAFDCDGDGDTDPNTISGATGASSSQATAAQITAGSSGSHRSASQSNGTIFPQLQ